ncbi:ParB N-terminal domain-containing protein [Thermosynechococcus sp. HN-54]|uniref:ParB N-terminal domain-containing protein n=1 Tax=Thermosynechococcus sp. HN-54 TaxID=2933959 RepID=UPI0037DC1B61
MASSILKAGICFPPLVVRRLGDRLACHRFKLLSGHRQYYAAQKANLKEINALILEENDPPEIEAAILSQIQPNAPVSEVPEEQKEEKVTEPSDLNQPVINSSEDLIKKLYQQNQQLLAHNEAIHQSLKQMCAYTQQLLAQNQSICQSLQEVQAALANINTQIASVPTSQVPPPTPTATLSGSLEDRNQPQLKIRLINQGSQAEIKQWLTNAGISEKSSGKYIKKIIEYRAQSPFQSLIHLKEILKLKSQTLTKLEKCPVPASSSFPH